MVFQIWIGHHASKKILPTEFPHTLPSVSFGVNEKFCDFTDLLRSKVILINMRPFLGQNASFLRVGPFPIITMVTVIIVKKEGRIEPIVADLKIITISLIYFRSPTQLRLF